MIECKHLSKSFQNETAIDYSDLVFEDGASYILLGASGCGKSTLLNLIAGILTPDRGTITIDSRDMGALSQKERDLFRIRKIGYIFQDFKLIPDMTVADNIDILRLEKIDTSGAGDLLARLGMAQKKNRKVRNLSGGEKQRVAIVRALVKKPPIILADEPTGNLNFAIGEQVIRELTEASKGKTLIAVSHDERLTPYFDHVIDMNTVTGGRYDAREQNAAEGRDA